MEAVAKPDRYPDYVASYGSAYWWVEMVYMSADGLVARIMLNEDTGKFHVVKHDGERGKEFNDDINSSDEDATTKS